MKFRFRMRSTVLPPTTRVQLDSATELQLSRFQQRLEDDIRELLTDKLKSALIDVSSFRLSITAIVIGEPDNSESWISTTPHGISSPTNQEALASSKSPSDHLHYSVGLDESSRQMEIASKAYRTQRSEDKHLFEGIIGENCRECNMPIGAMQHYKMFAKDGKLLPVV